MHTPLNTLEQRVLGVLIEKSLAQPAYYPMTVNAVVAACNQKSNRDPLMNVEEERVWDTLERLRERGLVIRLYPGAGSRVDRFKHDTKTALGWEKPQRAVMAELLLRGPQTVGELRSRCARMFPFDNTEAVTAVLDNLQNADPPFVAPLPRSPGQSAIRFAHLLYPEGERPVDAPAPATTSPADATSALPALPTGVLAAIQEEITALRAQLDELAQRVAVLEDKATDQSDANT